MTKTKTKTKTFQEYKTRINTWKSQD